MSQVHVHVLYPPSSRFDWSYYIETHMPLAGAKLDLVEWWVAKGVDATVPSTYQAIATLVFESVEKWNASFARAGAELMADFPNYTDATPVVQVTQVNGSGRKT